MEQVTGCGLISMFKNRLTSWNKNHLRLILVFFFLALAIPTAILIKQAYSQLKWEAFHHYRLQAEELVSRIDLRYKDLIKKESNRSFTDYSFINVTGNIKNNVLQRSPLSTYPINSSFPGIIGYFQIDNQGGFTTPLLPATHLSLTRKYGVSRKEKKQRLQQQNIIYKILSQNKLVNKKITNINSTDLKKPKENLDGRSGYLQSAPQSAFDKLQKQEIYKIERNSTLYSSIQGRVADLGLKKEYLKKPQKRRDPRSKYKQKIEQQNRRLEDNILSNNISLTKKTPSIKDRVSLNVNIFKSEIGVFEFNLLESGHFVLYRTVWKSNQRYIQGLLIKSDTFINETTKDSFYKTNISKISNLTVAYKGNILSAFPPQTLDTEPSRKVTFTPKTIANGTLLLQSNLSATLSKIELIFSVNDLPAGPGGKIIIWLSIILFIILTGGFFILYLLGLKQITLARQQQDFVSAVSHELKTPLTSIRMYSEILREGWATEEKKNQYYNYIYDESERLTRLINNILQLARMTRNELPIDLKKYHLSELSDIIYSKINSQIKYAHFSLDLNCPEELKEKKLKLDIDYFVQIIINLVDNAIKFSSKSAKKQIDIQFSMIKNKITLSIRDYGPGISEEQLQKIFKLFYRTENELTRETVGTGIGLSLVQQLVNSIADEITVVNKHPGIEFRIIFNPF